MESWAELRAARLWSARKRGEPLLLLHECLSDGVATHTAHGGRRQADARRGRRAQTKEGLVTEYRQQSRALRSSQGRSPSRRGHSQSTPARPQASALYSEALVSRGSSESLSLMEGDRTRPVWAFLLGSGVRIGELVLLR